MFAMEQCREKLSTNLCPSIPMKSGQESSSPIAVAGNLGEFKWLKLRSKSRLWQECTPKEIERAAKLSVRKSAPLEYYCASASGLDVARLGNGTLTSDERIRRKFEEQ